MRVSWRLKMTAVYLLIMCVFALGLATKLKGAEPPGPNRFTTETGYLLSATLRAWHSPTLSPEGFEFLDGPNDPQWTLGIDVIPGTSPERKMDTDGWWSYLEGPDVATGLMRFDGKAVTPNQWLAEVRKSKAVYLEIDRDYATGYGGVRGVRGFRRDKAIKPAAAVRPTGLANPVPASLMLQYVPQPMPATACPGGACPAPQPQARPRFFGYFR